MRAQWFDASCRDVNGSTHLLHDSSFTLGESNVPSRFVLNELDLDLPSLATWLVVVVIVVVGGSSRGALTLDASVFAIAQVILVGRRARRVLIGNFRGHDDVLSAYVGSSSEGLDELGWWIRSMVLCPRWDNRVRSEGSRRVHCANRCRQGCPEATAKGPAQELQVLWAVHGPTNERSPRE